jgi:TP53 regulating kinase and related kinases
MASHQLDLPLVFQNTSPPPALLAQGAEALVYKTHFLSPSQPCVLKYRPPKRWRHPVLDARLTRHRILAEARILVRCRREEVLVPAVLALDWEGHKGDDGDGEGGWMVVEWIKGPTIRAALNAWTRHAESELRDTPGSKESPVILELMQRIGRAIGKLHAIGVIHGDLTTSNLMLSQPGTVMDPQKPQLQPDLGGDVVLIDFGLAAGSSQEEDRAVDLYVLERAYASTHPTIEEYFQEVIRAYGESYKGAKQVLKKLEDVRQRGRKKSMIG